VRRTNFKGRGWHDGYWGSKELVSTRIVMDIRNGCSRCQDVRHWKKAEDIYGDGVLRHWSKAGDGFEINRPCNAQPDTDTRTQTK